MRQRCCQILLAVICTGTLCAQNNGVVINGKWANQIFITDVNGRPFENKYADVSGTPFFNAEYKYANIKLKQGRTFVNVKAKIDMVSQEIYFISSNGIEGYIEAGMVKEITYSDTTTEGILFYKFQTGFPPIDMKNGNTFYQILSEGRCFFIKSITKKVSERKNELSGEVAKDFETYENYYLFVKGEMKRLKKDKEFILAELSDKQAQVNQFVLSNKTNFKNNDQLIKLLNYYNAL